MKKLLYTLIGFFFITEGTSQQNPLFNQYIFNPLSINPAYAGSRDALSIVMLHRSQWVGFEGAPVTQILAAHTPLKNENMAIGLQLSNDLIGPTQNMQAKAVYAYKIRIGRGKLSFGLRAGIHYYQYNWDKITYKDPNDYAATAGKSTILTPDFDFGIYYATRTFFAGLAYESINRARLNIHDSVTSSHRQYMHANLIIGKAFLLSDHVIFKPSLLYRVVENIDGQGDLTLSFLFYEKIWLGATFRANYGWALLAEYILQQKVRIGYSVDVPFNGLKSYTGLSHEIFVGMDLNILKKHTMSPRYF